MDKAEALAKARAAKAALAAQAAKGPEQTEEPEYDAEAPDMQTEPAPGPDRAPEPDTIELAQEPHVEVPKPPAPDAMPAADAIGRLVEVQLVKAYAPEYLENEMGRLVLQGEIKQKVDKGTIIRLPAAEATRALRLGIALPTDKTFS